jgi:hypothetical protein
MVSSCLCGTEHSPRYSAPMRTGRQGIALDILLCMTVNVPGCRTYNYATPSSIRDRKAPKDGQQPCFTPKGRCHPSKSLMAASVRLLQSWAGLYRRRSLFTLFYRRHPHQKIETAPPWSYCCRGGLSLSCGYFPALSAPNHSIRGRKPSRENCASALCSLRRDRSTKTCGICVS